MLTVDDALALVMDNANPLEAELVSLEGCSGRWLAQDVSAAMTQPPFAASAMDGYAVKFGSAQCGETLQVIGEAPAGAPFSGKVSSGEAVRIFTGAPVPLGADHIVIQEEVERDGERIKITTEQPKARHIRNAGIDFKDGDILARKHDKLHDIHGSVFAAANISRVSVIKKPRVAIFANGDELKEPGSNLAPGEIVNSNHYALRSLVTTWGGEGEYCGIAGDSEVAVSAMFKQAMQSDIIVPIGGASVGDYDLVKPAFKALGGEILFEKVAMKPGKPTWFGRLGGALVLGLPGNPASAIVAAALFLQPLTRLLGGEAHMKTPMLRMECGTDIQANGPRESFLRAELSGYGANVLKASPVENQDSSLLSPFMAAQALIRRKPHAPRVIAGEHVDVIPLARGLAGMRR